MKSRTTIISVSFNSSNIIKKLLVSIPKDVTIKIVDNANDDDIYTTLKPFKNCELIQNSFNEGFGRACNRGASESKTEFLFFLNPDTTLEKNAISELEKFADKNPRMGAANPLIKNARNNFRLKTTSVVPCKKLPRPNIYEYGEMPILTGGALFVRRKVFEEVGGFDPNIFLYHEDHELCYRITKNGYSLWHVPSAEVVHIGGNSSGRSSKIAEWKGYHLARSRYYVLNMFYPNYALSRTFWPAILGLINPINLLSRRRFSKYKGQLKGALSIKKDNGVFYTDD